MISAPAFQPRDSSLGIGSVSGILLTGENKDYSCTATQNTNKIKLGIAETFMKRGQIANRILHSGLVCDSKKV